MSNGRRMLKVGITLLVASSIVAVNGTAFEGRAFAAQGVGDAPKSVQETAVEELKDVKPLHASEPAESKDSSSQSGQSEGSSQSADTSTEGQIQDYQYKLKEVGSFSADKDAVSFTNNVPHIKKSGSAQYIGQDGKPLMEGTEFSDIKYIGNGLYIVRKKNGGVNSLGVVSIDGSTLIPCEAAIINSSIDDVAIDAARFLEVDYATEKTTSKEEAFLYGHEDSFSLRPDEDDTLYTGYGRVYDLQKRTFVDGVKITIPQDDALVDMGETFSVTQGKTTTIYDAGGKQLWSQEAGTIDPEARFVCWRSDGKSKLIDANGKDRYTTESHYGFGSPHGSIPGWRGGDYALVQEDGESGTLFRVIDFDGRDVFDNVFTDAPRYSNGLFSLKDGEKTLAVAADGTQVSELKSGIFIEGVVPGYNAFTTAENKKAIAKGANVVAQGDEVDTKALVAKDSSGKYLVLNDGKYSMELDGVESLDAGLVRGRQSGAMLYGVYDLFTGKQLLADEYDAVGFAGDRLFVYKDGTWTVYEASLS